MLASDLYVACYTLNMRLLVDCIPTGGLCGFSSSITDVSIHNQALSIWSSHKLLPITLSSAFHFFLQFRGIQLWIIETG